MCSDGFHHRVASRQPKTGTGRDSSLALEAGVELEIVDMSVEAFEKE